MIFYFLLAKRKRCCKDNLPYSYPNLTLAFVCFNTRKRRE